MKLHTFMAGAAVLAFATGAIAQDAAAPATPGTTASDAAAPASDAAASTGAAATTAPGAVAPATADSAVATSSDMTTGAAAPTPDAASAAAAPAPQPGTADAQSAMTTPAADPAKAQAAEQMIAQNWTKYDKQNTGQLTPLEFGTWVLAAQGNDMSTQVEKSRQSRAANLPATKVLNATAAEFSKADTNKDRTISQDELRSYLSA